MPFLSLPNWLACVASCIHFSLQRIICTVLASLHGISLIFHIETFQSREKEDELTQLKACSTSNEYWVLNGQITARQAAYILSLKGDFVYSISINPERKKKKKNAKGRKNGLLSNCSCEV